MKLLVATGLVLASVATMAAPGDGIKNTRHDWSSPVNATGTGGGQVLLQWCPSTGCTNPTTGASLVTTYQGAGYVPYMIPDPVDATKQIQGSARVQFGLCTKCHTPHQARSTNLLWNHTLLATNYSWDQPKTTAGTNYPTFVGDSYKGPSTKCLSCHDGTMASTDGVWFKRQRVSGAKHVAAPGTLDSGHDVAHETGSMAGSHPVAFPYPLNGAISTYNGTTTSTALAFGEFVADPMATNGIRLFNDAAGNITAGKVAGSTGMECTSCHDVHNGPRVKDVMLLTGKVDGSDTAPGGYICTQCHKK